MHPTDRSPRLLRFGVFEIDLQDGELRRKGQKIKLQERPFQFLAALLERPGEVVSREELARKLWSDVVVDVDNGLNRAASKVRDALGDDANTPRYVETLPRRGYRFIAPVQGVEEERASTAPAIALAAIDHAPPPARPWGRRVAELLIGAAAVVLMASELIAPARAPSVERMTRLTETGRAEPGDPVITDGSRVYFTDRKGGRWSLAQVPVEGGDPVPVSTPPGNPRVLALSPNRSELLVAISTGVDEDVSLWIVPTVFGPPHKVPNVSAHAAVWSRDGSSIIAANGRALFRVNPDGTGVRKLADTAGRAYSLRWSPPGQRDILRFSVWGRQYSVWECAPDGSGLHLVMPVSTLSSPMLYGETAIDWTPGGKYFLFRRWGDRESTIWARPELRDWLHPWSHTSLQIYATSLKFTSLAASPDGKKLLFAGGQETRELVSYDASRDQFLPFLGGSPVRWVSFSKDAQSAAYSTIPEASLWRTRADGSERFELVSPPLMTSEAHWSPDGQRIAFCGQEPAKDLSVYTVPAAGGRAEKVTPEGFPACGPSWSPDGSSLMFGRTQGGIWTVDWRTRQTAMLPGSENLVRPAWSPDGRYVAAMGTDGLRIMLYDFRTRQWTELTRGEASLGVPFWSHDGRDIFFQRVLGSEVQPIYRLNIATRAIAEVASSRQIPQSGLTGFTLTGLTPGDAPIATVIRSNADIYSLEMDVP